MNFQLIVITVMSTLTSNCAKVKNQDSVLDDTEVADSIYYIEKNTLAQGQCPASVVPNRVNCPPIKRTYYSLFKTALDDYYFKNVSKI